MKIYYSFGLYLHTYVQTGYRVESNFRLRRGLRKMRFFFLYLEIIFPIYKRSLKNMGLSLQTPPLISTHLLMYKIHYCLCMYNVYNTTAENVVLYYCSNLWRNRINFSIADISRLLLRLLVISILIASVCM